MEILHALTQLDWTRVVRFWLLVAIGVASWESASLFGRSLADTFGRKS
jgi:hypothetical protein